MNKKFWIILLVVVVVILGVYAILKSRDQASTRDNVTVAFDPSNTTYIIDGQSVTLMDGRAEMDAAPGSASKITTAIFGQPTSGDLNGDGKTDAALILVQDSGGSGTFYYAAAAIDTVNGAQGTNAILLGDRVAPQNIEINNGQIVANYADRKPGEPMSATPSVGVSKYMHYNGSMLVISTQ